MIESIISAVELGLRLAALAIVCVALGMVLENGRQWLKQLDAKLTEALDFTGLFPEPKD